MPMQEPAPSDAPRIAVVIPCFDEAPTIRKVVEDFRKALPGAEIFVFDKARKLVYHGAFDDSGKADKVTKHYAEDAVKAVLKGEKPAVTTSKLEGCTIKFDK